VTAKPGDWIGFRGTARDGIVHGAGMATDWSRTPPTQIWKRVVGPAWSSVIVIGNRLYTQEQRGEKETVVCYDAASGEPVWVHEDAARFEEAVSGVGPRATPTFAKGRIVTLGGTGLLNCLDAETGERRWSRDIKTDSEAKTPMWGFAGSPLLVDDKIVVYAGGATGRSLLAYRLDSGDLAWTAEAGPNSYSSPQSIAVGGTELCLMLTDSGLTAVNPGNGEKLWQTGLVAKGAPRYGQPRLIGTNKLAVAGLDGTGVSLIEFAPDSSKWNIKSLWISRDLKPEFPDFVVHEGYAYGFDVSIFCCLDLSTGKRTWKEGRYGRGQVILLADQALLLVVSEGGEAVLLAADPENQKELGRFQALQGKTWNHPVVSASRLYLRNAEEMACYALPVKQ
jgi:outer membrane protein assembly factor BamB